MYLNNQKKENKKVSKNTQSNILNNNSNDISDKNLNKNQNQKHRNINNKLRQSFNFNNYKKRKFFQIVLVKLFLIFLFVFGYFYSLDSYSNEISLLAVNEDNQGDIYGGSIISLYLETKRGSGNVYVNLNTVEDIDTQISIINSKDIACDLFELDCDNYDFYFKFDGSAFLLKGPSASSAIAILVSKTLNKQKIDDKIAITGSLNSGGIIGNVGGVSEKIKVAEKENFKKILIPEFTEFDNFSYYENSTIEIVRVLDIVDAYNHFSENKNLNFELKKYEIKQDEYNDLMNFLATSMCDDYNDSLDLINFSILNESLEQQNYFNISNKSYNLGLSLINYSKFYSAGSFCYNANINLNLILNLQSNISIENINSLLDKREKEFNFKYIEINTQEQKDKIKTINDFYSYLIIQDRIDEARELIKNAKELTFIKESNKSNLENSTLNVSLNIISNTNMNNTNNTINDSSNETLKINLNSNLDKLKLEENQIELKNNIILNQKITYLSFAEERFKTVLLWEKFISNQGNLISFDENKLQLVCNNIQKQILMKSALLETYNINYLNDEINKFNSFTNPFSNNYLCIYKGLELNGRINTILNSAGISNSDSNQSINKIIEFTKLRLSLNSKGDFPLIPFIYQEYSSELLNNGDTSSAMLYSNYALSYLDLNLYLEDKLRVQSFINLTIIKIFSNLWFFVGFLFILSFL